MKGTRIMATIASRRKRMNKGTKKSVDRIRTYQQRIYSDKKRKLSEYNGFTSIHNYGKESI
ncbi:hypothetical protein FQR65_LT10866 [Abscondita terminalis]|nr:hypothetical protein FQR65_LT10866 [Abscondita terminalis]